MHPHKIIITYDPKASSYSWQVSFEKPGVTGFHVDEDRFFEPDYAAQEAYLWCEENLNA